MPLYTTVSFDIVFVSHYPFPLFQVFSRYANFHGYNFTVYIHIPPVTAILAISCNGLRGLYAFEEAMWALDSEISTERSEHLRFREPQCHSAPLSIPLQIFAQTLYF